MCPALDYDERLCYYALIYLNNFTQNKYWSYSELGIYKFSLLLLNIIKLVTVSLFTAGIINSLH